MKIQFILTRNETVHSKGAKEVDIVTTGYEKHRATVMLGVIIADGNKISPYLILKRKLVPEN